MIYLIINLSIYYQHVHMSTNWMKLCTTLDCKYCYINAKLKIYFYSKDPYPAISQASFCSGSSKLQNSMCLCLSVKSTLLNITSIKKFQYKIHGYLSNQEYTTPLLEVGLLCKTCPNCSDLQSKELVDKTLFEF